VGDVHLDGILIGTFEPDNEGTTGDVHVHGIDIGDFELEASGFVYIDSIVIGTYTATALPPPEEPTPSAAEDARLRTTKYLTTYIHNPFLTKDDNTTPIAFAIMYAYPNYPLIREFDAATDPVDLLFLIGKPTSEAMMQADQTPWGYHERVPIIIACIDKTGITAELLIWKAERELRRICEVHPAGSQRKLIATTERTVRLGSTVIVQAEYILDYTRDTT
jgi:hypothetical protein